ncbi:MAG: ribbon-helix-helix protein, CopG family [Gemmatimonadota bacterium]|nr:ribbon-helix-helix protein, CopG family [Gemmatimonadota bacterium]
MVRSFEDFDPDDDMPRLTISLSDSTHRALKEASARQGRSMGAIIEESLELRGVRPIDTARDIVARARAQARLEADEAAAVAVRETRLHREGR